MSARRLLLQAPNAESDQWNGTEKGKDREFRWSRATPLVWPINSVSRDGFSIVIPWLVQIEPDFMKRARLLVDGQEIATSVGEHAGMACLKASFDGTKIGQIALETPAPIRSPGNPNDDRLLGAALPLPDTHDRPSSRVSKTPVAINDPARPQICLIGNCQVQTYTWLMERMLGGPVRAVADLSGARIRQKEFQSDFLEKCRGADLVLTMPNQYMPEEEIHKWTAAPVYSMVNLYFRGTLPDVAYIGTIDSRLTWPSGYHSLVVLDAWHRGVPEHEVEAQFDMKNFERLGLLDTWRSSEESIIQRAQGIDFPASQMMMSAARRYNAFLTVNHPSVLLCYEYLQMIFDTLGVPYRNFDFGQLIEPLAVHDQCIVHDEWAEYLKLPYRTTQRYKMNELGYRWVTRRELIHHYYAKYSTVPLEKLRVNSPLDLTQALKLSPELAHLVEQ